MANDGDENEPSQQPVILKERYAISFDVPLKEFSSEYMRAFHVEDLHGGELPFFAIAAQPTIPIRKDNLEALFKVDLSGLLTLVEWGMVFVPQMECNLLVLIYVKPMGGRILPEFLNEVAIDASLGTVNSLIMSLSLTIKSMKNMGITHRSIRPSNMFWASPRKDVVVLGDCIIVPPAFEQPAMFEAVESAMAMPSARGNGSSADDCYSLGASFAFLMQDRTRISMLSDDQVINQKINHGSYGFLAASVHASTIIHDFLRGTLNDDPKGRWNSDDMEAWSVGHQALPVKSKVNKLAAKTFVFNRSEYLSTRELAIAINRDWRNAYPQLCHGRLEMWLRRAFERQLMATSVNAIMKSIKYDENTEEGMSVDIGLTRICIILDADAPVRYKSLSVMPDGWGTLIAIAMSDQAKIGLVIEALLAGIPKIWFDSLENSDGDMASLDNILQVQKKIIGIGDFGQGIERVAYNMNSALPCLSPMIINYFVFDLDGLLPALNAFAEKGGERSGLPFDRHIAAFICARATFGIDEIFLDINDKDKNKSDMAILRLFAIIQTENGQDEFQALTEWLANSLLPVIDGYHNIQTKQELEREIRLIGQEKTLVDLLSLLGNSEIKAKDINGFNAACAEWDAMWHELQEISKRSPQKLEKLVFGGQHIAAMFSASFCMLVFVIVLLWRMF